MLVWLTWIAYHALTVHIVLETTAGFSGMIPSVVMGTLLISMSCRSTLLHDISIRIGQFLRHHRRSLTGVRCISAKKGGEVCCRFMLPLFPVLSRCLQLSR